MRNASRRLVALTLALSSVTTALVVGAQRETTARPPFGESSQAGIPRGERIRVLFSPGGGCTEAIVREIGRARNSVDVQAYSFTSAPIAKAVTDAHARGVKVRIILDKSQRTERYSSATFLKNHDVPVFIDDEHAIAHNKVILIDGKTVITGSFNFSKAAEERNAENLLIIEGRPDLASAYTDNFEEHLHHTEAYTGPKPKK